MGRFVTENRVYRSQHSLSQPNLSQPKELKSDCTVNATWLTAYHGEGKLAVPHLQRNTVKCDNEAK